MRCAPARTVCQTRLVQRPHRRYAGGMSNVPINNSFIKEDPWRIFRIMAEFVDSFETLSRSGRV